VPDHGSRNPADGRRKRDAASKSIPLRLPASANISIKYLYSHLLG